MDGRLSLARRALRKIDKNQTLVDEWTNEQTPFMRK